MFTPINIISIDFLNNTSFVLKSDELKTTYHKYSPKWVSHLVGSLHFNSTLKKKMKRISLDYRRRLEKCIIGIGDIELTESN